MLILLILLGFSFKVFDLKMKETENYKTSCEKSQKELLEIKKENKKRKKMIETQQGLINVSSSNYHQCAYCSKVFLNVGYLQAHVTRRHSDMATGQTKAASNEIEKELERIKDRLKTTENDLAMERTARLNALSIMPRSSEVDSSPLLRQMEEAKNAELKRQRDEFKRSSDSLKAEFAELCKKNDEFEREIRDLQEKLGKKSNVGWMKDDIDIQKDAALKQRQEIEKLNILVCLFAFIKSYLKFIQI